VDTNCDADLDRSGSESGAEVPEVTREVCDHGARNKDTDSRRGFRAARVGSGVARRHGLNANLIFKWLKCAREAGLIGAGHLLWSASDDIVPSK